MIFDSINEVLDTMRRGGLQGETLPHRFLWNTKVPSAEARAKQILALAKDRVLQLSTFMCGFIQNKDDSFLQLPIQLDEEIITQIKEDRLFKLLQYDVRDYEGLMVRTDNEKYEVMLEVSNFIFQDLFEDLALFLETI